MFRLVFWWLMCVPVFFLFLIFQCCSVFGCSFYSKFFLLCSFINFICAHSVFNYVYIYALVCSLTPSAPLFQLCSPTNLNAETIVAQCLKLTSLNVKGLINFRKRRTILLCCRKRKEDLVFLQETHSIAATENLWRNESGTEMISYHDTSNYCSRRVLKVLTQYSFVNPVCNCF